MPSKLTILNPFFERNLIKVGGIMWHAYIVQESNHQIILSKDDPLTQLIVRNTHEDNLHTDREDTIAISRQCHWISN